MSTSKSRSSARNRVLRPMSEGLETREMLSATVSGMDSKGDHWTLNLIGPGSLLVQKPNDASGNPQSLNSLTDIQSITVAGTNPLQSRLIGTVQPAPGSDGKVFFQNFTELGNPDGKLAGGDGLLSIQMPNFWLGYATQQTSTSTPGTTPTINIPDGVSTFQFGGVDTTYNVVGAAPSSATNDNSAVNLGLPLYGGTRILIDQSISSSQPSSSTTSTNPILHGVLFNVQGRLDLFQANQVIGDTSHPSTLFPGSGGTIVESLASTAPATAGVTGQIGFVRVGGNATNFSALTNSLISNFYVGGETNNVNVLGPTGVSVLLFGKGMDTTSVYAHIISKIESNRGAVNSTVISDKQIGKVLLGGDVVGTHILSGYNQNLSSVSSTNPPSSNPSPISNGSIVALVAGNVTNSVFAASTNPFNNTFGTPNDMKLPQGKIQAKVEGAINNATATPDSPNTAFYAQTVQLVHGPVVPPNVVEQPYTGPQTPQLLPGLNGVPVIEPGNHFSAKYIRRGYSGVNHHLRIYYPRTGPNASSVQLGNLAPQPVPPVFPGKKK